ncbi:hypothetical protein LZZ85_10195 [Terrimonas sp. NA20]|uniref:Aspartyl protease n=1 Tax=Terrimonas ginsenosidimutans TaxID=2908004 RepID=A0ABS9KQT0_9BACT|nr:hypothetical protein [Terrimonas ginsenosidimutans]MCG2614654.1 hypothetical protein [Terrimonas ginsenosidimutans]
MLFFKKLCLSLATVIFFLNATAQNIAPNYLEFSGDLQTIPFRWKADSLNGAWDRHAAILIPVKLKNCPKEFFMQFDLGAPSSLVYTQQLASIAKLFPKAVPTLDSNSKIHSFEFTAGKTKIKAQEIAAISMKGEIDWRKNSVNIIGTLGSDLIDNREVVIDYPGQKLLINCTPGDDTVWHLSDLLYTRRSVLLPAVIQGKQTILYFDTGSSAFELLTNEKTAHALATTDAAASRYPVSSWGKTLTAVSLPTADSITIAGVKLPLNKATYIEGVSDSQINQMMKMGIGGMTGNKLFLHSKLYLDLKNKKFALISSSTK